MTLEGESSGANDEIRTPGLVFLLATAIALLVLFGLAGWLLVEPIRQERLASAERHRNRLDPQVAESGLTPADLVLPPGASPTSMRVGIYVDRIAELSVKEAHWTVDFYVWFRWQGDAIPTEDGFQVVDGQIESKEKVDESVHGGEHYERYRVVAKISKAFDVSRFPCDDHLLTINFENPKFLRNQLLFVADRENSAVSSRVFAPAYEIYEHEIIEKPHLYQSTRGDPRLTAGARSVFSQCRMGLGIRRTSWGFYFKLFQALYVAVIIATLAMFVKPTNVDPRFGLGVGGLFAAVANSYVASSLIPDTGIMTLADIVNGIGIGTILLTVIQSTVSLYLYEQLDAPALSRRFDLLCFALLAFGFTTLNIALPWAACA